MRDSRGGEREVKDLGARVESIEKGNKSLDDGTEGGVGVTDGLGYSGSREASR